MAGFFDFTGNLNLRPLSHSNELQLDGLASIGFETRSTLQPWTSDRPR